MSAEERRVLLREINLEISSPEVDLENLSAMQGFQIRYYNTDKSAVYVGQMVNSKELPAKLIRHGFGIMRYENGKRQYEGQWFNDLRDGKGFERYSNKNSYFGGFKAGKAHGRGVYKWANGEVYDGEWNDGLKHGHGIWKSADGGDSYIGEWRHSKAEGYGLHIWRNGDRYEGEWKQCLKHGNGLDTFANGDTYQGEFLNGKAHGKGTYTWAGDCSNYVGEFFQGLKQGKGRWRSGPTGQQGSINQYEGEYLNDRKHGFGTFTWASGNVYKGEYKEDERHGQGEMTWTDGTSYVGEWCHGIQHGHGKMIMPDGTIKEGYFDCNVYKGPKSVASRGSTVSSQMTFSTIEKSHGMSNSKYNRGMQGRDFNAATISSFNVGASNQGDYESGSFKI